MKKNFLYFFCFLVVVCIAQATVIDNSPFNAGSADGWAQFSTGPESAGADFSNNDFRTTGGFSQYYKDLNLTAYKNVGLNISYIYTFSTTGYTGLGLTNQTTAGDYFQGDRMLLVSSISTGISLYDQSGGTLLCGGTVSFTTGDKIAWLIYPNGMVSLYQNNNLICSVEDEQISYSNLLIWSRYSSQHIDDILVQTIVGDPCEPTWICDGYNTCVDHFQSCNLVTDANLCGGSYSGDYQEFEQQSCDNLKVSGFGDSITANQFGYVFMLGQIPGITSYNHGVSGDEASNLISRLNEDTGQGYNWTILMVGSNEAYHSIDQTTYHNNLVTLVNAIRADGQNLLISSIPPCSICSGSPADYNKIIRQVSYDMSVCFAEAYFDDFGGSFNQADFSDGIHPNGIGHAKMNSTFYAAMNNCERFDCSQEPTLCSDYSGPVCTPDWVCVSYGACSANNTRPCDTAMDNNNCADQYEGDYSEFTPQVCDYCTPSWSCNGYGACQNSIKSCNSVTDNHSCNEAYSGNYSEFQTSSCVVSRSGGSPPVEEKTPIQEKPEVINTNKGLFSTLFGDNFNFISFLDNIILSIRKFVGLQQ